MPQAKEHQGRVAVVTGGVGAIGGAIARRLHDEGATVHVLDLKPAHASEWSFHSVDVANEAEVDTTFDAIGKTARNVDYLVC
ncbi:MAG TPA: SDR family NAD(P)-dependent oxidoreductase, partial [Candidatus Binatia bacterium]|nr:SDR family NAD(P)-dependent oxidoreductase [Candidatus Binatia bacterium]